MRAVFIYRGRVQGVGFRATARRIAAGLPVTGWVRNEHDGSVRLEAQGSEHAIATLTADIQRSLGTLITGVERLPASDRSDEMGFVIAH